MSSKEYYILYFGHKSNHLSKSVSVLDFLTNKLSGEYRIVASSNKERMLHKMIDMFYTFVKYVFKTKKVLIDVYSTKAFYYALVFTFLSFIFKKKIILILHGGNLPNRFHKNPILVSWMLTKANIIVAPSKYLAEFFIDKGFEVRVIPNAIEIEKYKFKLRDKLRPRIFAMRGFGQPYNPLMTLMAIKELKFQFPDLHLLMLGNANEFWYNDVIEFVEKNDLRNVVTIKGKMPKSEWITLSQDFDIMVSNPTTDNMPVSLIEGMALGMCVISTKVGGVPYLVCENECALVDQNDATALSKAILRTLQDAVYAQQLSRNGREKAEEFDWGNIRPQWENLLSL